MNFEKARDIDYLKLDSVKRAWEKVQTKAEEGIKEKDFVGIYEASEIEEDLKRVAEKKANIIKNTRPEDREQIIFGKILEALIEEMIDLNALFGEEVSAVRTSGFDDYFNGVDMVTEINERGGKKYLALAIDATHGDTFIGDKFAQVKQEIDEGTLSTVKYYQDSEGNKIPDGLKKCPRVILGLDKEQIVELATLWVDGKDKELATHPHQLMLLEEVVKQLEAFGTYASTTGKSEIAGIYEAEHKKFARVLEVKKRSVGKTVDMNKWQRGKGRVYESIMRYTKRFEWEQGNESGTEERASRLDPSQREAIRRIRRSM